MPMNVNAAHIHKHQGQIQKIYKEGAEKLWQGCNPNPYQQHKKDTRLPKKKH